MRDTIDMAREAGFPLAWISNSDGGVIRWADIKKFEALVRADEREACAKACDSIVKNPLVNPVASVCAIAIRARGETK